MRTVIGFAVFLVAFLVAGAAAAQQVFVFPASGQKVLLARHAQSCERPAWRACILSPQPLVGGQVRSHQEPAYTSPIWYTP